MGTAVEIADLKSIKERFSFAGKKGFVTGAAGGIGRSTAAALAELGGQVALVDINLEKAQENADEINKRFGTDCFGYKCDVTDQQAINKMIEDLVAKMGKIDFVHSNAGIIAGSDGVDMPKADWDKMVAVNLTGMMMIDQAAARQMKAQGHGGAIVNTASMSGHIVNNTHNGHASICYTATKAGVMHLTKSFAIDYAPEGIRFNSVSPGYMLSGIHDGLPQELLDSVAVDNPLNRFGTMDEIGGLVAFLLSDLASFIIGSDVLVDGGHCIW